MSTIPKGAVVTVVVGDAQTVAAYSGGSNPQDVLNAVSAYLNGLGAYQVESSSYSGGMLSSISPLIQETFQGTLNMQLNFDTDTSSIVSDIQQAFDVVTQQTPTNVTIPSYSTSGIVTSTGQASPTPTTAQSTTSSIASFFSGLGATATGLLIGLAAIIIIVLVLIAYGPNVGKIASAA